ncbi:MAG: WD40 repeat domain-containing protein [Sedimentisphaerales bacterium]|nr:WD40 repeat domain-containing protein [Sedimentisphaerales bacterium]
MAFSSDGRFLLSAGTDEEDGTVRLWDVETGEEPRRYRAEGYSAQYGSVAFVPVGKHIVAGSYMGNNFQPHAAWLWDIDTSSAALRRPCHALRRGCDGRLLAGWFAPRDGLCGWAGHRVGQGDRSGYSTPGRGALRQ